MSVNYQTYILLRITSRSPIYLQASCFEMSATKPRRSKEKVDPKLTENILRTVSVSNAFYFYTDIEQYTNRYSACLRDFCNTVQSIDVKSVEFHSKRGDFAAWIKGTLGDTELANKLNKIRKTAKGEELRTLILKALEARLAKLKKLEAAGEPHLELPR